MKMKEKNQVVDFVLTQTAYLLLAKSPIKDELQKRAQAHEGKLRAALDPEEFAPIGEMRNVIDELAHLLVNCDNVDALQNAHAYLKDLNQNKVLIARQDPTGEVTGYDVNT